MNHLTVEELESLLDDTGNALAREIFAGSIPAPVCSMASKAMSAGYAAVERVKRLQEEMAYHPVNMEHLADRLRRVEADRDRLRINAEYLTTELRMEETRRSGLRQHCDGVVERLAAANGRLEQLTALANLFATCPACGENPCVGACTFERDCPDDYALLNLARLAMEEE